MKRRWSFVVLSCLMLVVLLLAFSACREAENGGVPADPCADGHDEGEWVVDLEATKTEDGKRHLVCKHCGITIREETLYATGTAGLQYEVNEDGVTCTITGYKDSLGDELYIPRYIDGYRVVSLGDSAFHLSSIKKAFIPDCLEEIYVRAFHDCTKLEEVVFGENSQLQYVREEAFEGCHKLNKIELPQGTLQIDRGAFEDCRSLQTFVIPPRVTVIEPSVFSHCGELKSVVIPNGVTMIQTYAFSQCTALESLTLPESLTAICDYAFTSCSNLESINLDNITYIGAFAFQHCKKLLKTVMNGNVTCVQGWVVDNYKDTVSVLALPEGCVGIAYGVFRSEARLSQVVLPNSMKYIGDVNFTDCKMLTTIVFGTGVEHVGFGVFASSPNIKNVYISDVAAWTRIDYEHYSATPMQYGATLYLDGEPVTKLTIPNGVERIGDYSFYGCNSITEVTIPDSVTSIGDLAFRSCIALKSVTIGEGVKTIGDGAFGSCSALTSITIPDSVTKIGSGAFLYCNTLKTVTLGAGVEAIEKSTFSGCFALESITIPKRVTRIGESACCSCKSLNAVYYYGTAADWDQIQFDIFTSEFTDTTRYYYSETLPTAEGNYWHLVDGVPTPW